MQSVFSFVTQVAASAFAYSPDIALLGAAILGFLFLCFFWKILLLILKLGVVCVAGFFFWQLSMLGIEMAKNPSTMESAKEHIGSYGVNLADAVSLLDRYEVEFSIKRKDKTQRG